MTISGFLRTHNRALLEPISGDLNKLYEMRFRMKTLEKTSIEVDITNPTKLIANLLG